MLPSWFLLLALGKWGECLRLRDGIWLADDESIRQAAAGRVAIWTDAHYYIIRYIRRICLSALVSR